MSMSNITHVVIHYSATYEDQQITAADIDRMHKANGWAGIGYHWLIRRDGTEEQGRPETQVGAHVGGQNSGKLGICWAGGLNRATGSNRGVDNRTPAQTARLIERINKTLVRWPRAAVVGHRDLAATQCPGFDVRSWWAQVQQQTPSAPPAPVLPSAPAVTLGVGEDRLHVVAAGDTWWSISREHGLGLSELLRLNSAKESDVLRAGAKVVVAPYVAAGTDPRIPAALAKARELVAILD